MPRVHAVHASKPEPTGAEDVCLAGIFEEGDRVEIKDDSKTFKKVTFGKICGKLLEATIVRTRIRDTQGPTETQYT